MRRLALIIFLFYAGSVHADRNVACVSGAQIRVLTLDYEIDGQKLPCQVIYKKGQDWETLWTAQGSVGFCESKLGEFLDKQKGWGWRCTDMDMSVLGDLQ